MIFITGGAYQGKTEYARKHYRVEDGYTILNQYHMQVRKQLEEGLDPVTEAGRLWESGQPEGAGGAGGRLVVISDEVGCGLVPVDAFERKYREACGRVCCALAEQAEQVIRVVCGIGVKLK